DTAHRDFVAEIEKCWGRDAVDVVLDPVGGAAVAGDLQVLKTAGRIVILSTMSGSETSLDLALLMKKRARIVGSTLRARSRAEKAAIVSRFKGEILPGFTSGALRVVVDAVFPVARAAGPDTVSRSDTVNLYAAAGANALSGVAAGARPLVYVPNSHDGTVTVIDPRTYHAVRTFATGALPQHVVPSHDLTTLWVAN